jgi:hypothetical protein
MGSGSRFSTSFGGMIFSNFGGVTGSGCGSGGGGTARGSDGSTGFGGVGSGSGVMIGSDTAGKGGSTSSSVGITLAGGDGDHREPPTTESAVNPSKWRSIEARNMTRRLELMAGPSGRA